MPAGSPSGRPSTRRMAVSISFTFLYQPTRQKALGGYPHGGRERVVTQRLPERLFAAVHNAFSRGTIVKLTIDKAEGCGNVEVSIDRATAKDIGQAPAVHPENTRKLLALVRKDSEPPYRPNRCGFAAILKGKR